MEFTTKTIQFEGLKRNILLQNENGPCALVALTNLLVLSPQHKRDVQELIQLLNSNYVVSLQDLITTFANIGVMMDNGQSDDVNELLQLLPQLHAGLNVNPAFNGTFHDNQALALFRLFQVSLTHGWLVDPERNIQQYERVSNYSYDDAQNLLVQAYDIQKNSVEVENSENILQDAQYLKSFLARSATQLTEYGINHLKELLVEGSYSVFFRNDHFSTMHKRSGELFLLVTDLGFKDRADIVWQQLKSVKGNNDGFFTADFFPVSLERIDGTSGTEIAESSPAEPEMTDEQLARMLQEEEDAEYVKNLQQTQQRNNNTESRRPLQKKDVKTEKRKRKLKKCVIL